MKRLLKAAAALVCAASLTALASTPTATVSDTDGTVWANCNYTATLTIPGGESTPAPTIGGITVSPLVVTGSCNASGAISPTLTDTSTVDQPNAQWVFTIQSNTSAAPVKVSTPVVGSAPDLTKTFSLLPAPRFATGANAYGYNDSEIQGVPQVGATYYNVSIPGLKQYSLAGWSAVGSSGTSSQALLAQIPSNGLIGLYTHADCAHPYKDYSGNGNDGTAVSGTAEPVCDAKGLSYYTSGVLSAWQLPPAATSQTTTYIFGILPFLGNARNGAVNQSIMQSSSTGGVLTLIGSGSPGNYNDAWRMGMGNLSQYRTTYSSSLIPAASTIAYSIGTGVSGDKDTMWNNGKEVPYVAQGSTTPAVFNVGTMQIGGNSFPFFGTEGVTALYSRKLTADEQVKVSQAINNYMQSTSGMIYPRPLALGLNSKIVCNGDSITYGIGVPNSWCTQPLLSVGETVDIDNSQSTSGKYLAAISIRAPQEIIPAYTLNNKNTAYIFAGTNDIFGNVPPALAWSNATNAINRARYPGAKIVWMSMLSRNNADSNKNAFDILANAQCAMFADYCVAPTDPLLYADGAYANTTYFQGDGIHPTTAGQTLLALYASNAYKQLYGSTKASPTQVSASTYTVTASDNYITATANSVITLYNCLGYSRFVAIKVMPGLTVSVKNATSAQTIDGVDHSSSALALTAGSNYKFQVVPGDPSTGGCTWVIN